MLKIHYIFPDKYRGYTIGYHRGMSGFVPIWMSSLDSMWREGCVVADSHDDALDLAKQCIDCRWRKSAISSR